MRKAILLLALAVPARAWAEPPCVCDPPWSFPMVPTVPPPIAFVDAAVPEDPHVPRNAQIFVTWANADPEWFEFVTADGTPVPFTVESAGSDDAGQFWVRPAALLDADATYTVREGDNSIRFSVDDAEDAAPPDHSRVVGQGARLKGRCPEHIAAEVRAVREVTVDGDDRQLALDETEPYGVLYEVTVRRLGDSTAPPPRHFFLRGEFPYFGEVLTDDYRFQACFENYQDAETTWNYEATVKVWDQAGNAAEAPDADARKTTFRFAYNVSEGCGCRVGARRDPGGGLLALAFSISAAAIRRSGRSGRPSRRGA